MKKTILFFTIAFFLICSLSVNAVSITDTISARDAPKTYTLGGTTYSVEQIGSGPTTCDYNINNVEFIHDLPVGSGQNFKSLTGSIETIAVDQVTRICTFKLSTEQTSNPVAVSCQNTCSVAGVRTCQGDDIYACKVKDGCLVYAYEDSCRYPEMCSAGACVMKTCQQIVTSVGSWSACSAQGISTRQTLYNHYGNVCENDQAITETKSCTPSCLQSINYGQWSSCDANGKKTRTLTYANYMNVCNAGATQTQQETCGTQQCQQSVSYGPYSECDGLYKTRKITYTNYQDVCGSTYSENQYEGCYTEGCQEEIQYSEWSNCISGEKTRSILYFNRNGVCGNDEIEPETAYCSSPVKTQPTPQPVSVEQETFPTSTLPQSTNEDNSNIDKTPIVFVHGYCIFDKCSDSENAFKEMDQKLSQLIFEINRETTNNPLNPSIEYRAAMLKKQIEEFQEKNMYTKKVNIIAHSMGGLIARYYIEQMGGDKYVNKLIMLGTPNHGTNFARTQNRTEANEMEPNSKFLKQLNEFEIQKPLYFNTEYYTIRGIGDTDANSISDGVVSLESAKLAGVPKDKDKIVHCYHTTITSPTQCKEAYTFILDVLNNVEETPSQTQNSNPITPQPTVEVVQISSGNLFCSWFGLFC